MAEVFQTVAFVLVAVGGTVVALTREPRRQVFASGLYGLLLTLLFFGIESADVALSELAIGTAALPALLLLTLAKVGGKKKP
jgi:uncharacterized MnhB-related membrane protein